MSLKNKIILLAGSTGAIAISITQMLLKESATVIIPAKSANDLLWIKEVGEISGHGSVVTMLTDYPDFYKAVEIINDIDLSFVCFESPGTGTALSQLAITDWERMIEQNLTAFFVAARLSLNTIEKHHTGMFISVDFTTHTVQRAPGKLARLSRCMQKEMAKILFEETRDTHMRYYHLFVDPGDSKTLINCDHIQPDELGALILDLYNGNTKGKEHLFRWMDNN
jgi:NADP-dependent 3-hydroxy acid dehydrogenase YdfG